MIKRFLFIACLSCMATMAVGLIAWTCVETVVVLRVATATHQSEENKDERKVQRDEVGRVVEEVVHKIHQFENYYANGFERLLSGSAFGYQASPVSSKQIKNVIGFSDAATELVTAVSGIDKADDAQVTRCRQLLGRMVMIMDAVYPDWKDSELTHRINRVAIYPVGMPFLGKAVGVLLIVHGITYLSLVGIIMLWVARIRTCMPLQAFAGNDSRTSKISQTAHEGILEIPVSAHDVIYVKSSHLLSRGESSSFIPTLATASPIARLIHRVYWLKQAFAEDGVVRIRGASQPGQKTLKIIIPEGEEAYVDVKDLVGFSIHGGRPPSGIMQRLLCYMSGIRVRGGGHPHTHLKGLASPFWWAMGHPLPVFFKGPVTVYVMINIPKTSSQAAVAQIRCLDLRHRRQLIDSLPDNRFASLFGAVFFVRSELEDGITADSACPVRGGSLFSAVFHHALISTVVVTAVIVLLRKLVLI